jgi:zinc protease
MFKETDDLPAGAFSRIVAENGGEDNAFTSTDYTGYIQRVAADRLDLVMGMEADRMAGLAPGEAGVLAERDVVIEERRQTTDSDPVAGFIEETTAALYLNHPYGRPVIGWEREIAALSPAAAMAFYRAHYAPNNAILVIAGDADVDAVRTLAEQHFGPIPASSSVVPRDRPQEPPHRAALRVEMHDARISEPLLSRTYLAPARRPGDQREAAALSILAELLGGPSVTSVMAREFLFGERRALQAQADYRHIGVDSGAFSFFVVPSPGVGLAETEAALDALLERVIEAGPDAAQLDRVKGQVRASEIYVLDDPFEQANRVGSALATGLTLDDVVAWPGLLQAVTAEEVQAAARSLFRIENAVTGWLSPAEAGAPEPAR